MSGIKSFKGYMQKYGDMQEDITLCYRPTLDKGWNDRCLYQDTTYDEYKPYNHRSILNNEIVIEFDEDDKETNTKYAELVIERLRKDKVAYSLWDSGNKSHHVHFLLDMKQCLNISLLKKVVMRHYTEGFPIKPDMRLAGLHLVRAEFGVHEKSGSTKHKIKETTGYPKVSTIKEEIWEDYKKEQIISVKRRLSRDLTDLSSHPLVRYLLNTVKFQNKVGDGHERTLFMLIHVLKPKYDSKEKLTKFLCEWYRYSSGTKLRDFEIRNKVKYHWNRDYCITENFLHDLADELNINIEAIKNELRKDG